MENMLGLFRCGHYNEVALLLRWPLSEVSLYGASAVVATDKNNQQAVFIAGCFKGEGMPCNVIEQIPGIITKEDNITGKKRSGPDAAPDCSCF